MVKELLMESIIPQVLRAILSNTADTQQMFLKNLCFYESLRIRKNSYEIKQKHAQVVNFKEIKTLLEK